MAKPRDPFDLQKVTINLRLGDLAWLQRYHGLKGASKIIREMVAAHIDRIDAQYAKMKEEE